MTLSLRTLDQPQNSFPLFAGMFSFGNGEDDDILVGNASNLFKAIFVDDVLIIQNANIPLWIDGKVIESFPMTLNPLAVLSINADTHLFYGAEDADVPSAPVIPVEAVKATQSVSPKLIYRICSTIIATGMLLLAGSLLYELVFPPEPIQLPIPIQREFDEEEYIKRVLDKDIREVKKDGNGWMIVATENPRAILQEKDLKSVLRTPFTIRWVNLEKLTIEAKNTLSQELGQGFTLYTAPLKIEVLGVATAGSKDRIERAIAKTTEKHPLVAIENHVHWVAPRFTIVSTAISNRYAGALLRQGEETVWVPEGGNVFGLGKLKLITANAIVIHTPHGDLTISKVN